ncbi:MAG: alpha/beta hydrolase, partial [Gammaproteobacteria bacterium]|nr:alpha/beta hydrolase [Gammaproteobacteria bacterium]
IQSDADTGVFPSDAKTIFQQLSSSDKELQMIGGDHYLQEPKDARADVADLIHGWLQTRL